MQPPSPTFSVLFLTFTIPFTKAFAPSWSTVFTLPQQWLALSQGFANPSYDPDVDIWNELRKGAPFLRSYADDIFDDIATTSDDVASQVKVIKAHIQAFVDGVQEFREVLHVETVEDGVVNPEGAFLGDISGDIDRAFQEILERMRTVFPAPDKVARHVERRQLVESMLEEAESKLVQVLCEKHRTVDEDALHKFWHGINSSIQGLALATGDLAEQHPDVVEFVLVGGIFMFAADAWFFRPLLRVIGFGPVKVGSLDACAQRILYGVEVGTDSIFVLCQRAAMKEVTTLFLKAVAGLGVAFSILAASAWWLLCRRR